MFIKHQDKEEDEEWNEFENSYRQKINEEPVLPPNKGGHFLRNFFWFVLVAIIIVGGANLYFKFFTLPSPITAKWESEKIKLTMIGPGQAVSGAVNDFVLKLDNLGEVGLNNAEISLSFPSGFEIISSEPDFSQKLVSGGIWKTPFLAKQENREIKIKGIIYGQTEEKKNFNLAVNYQPENFSASFSDTTSYEIKIGSALYNLSFNFPDKVLSGQEQVLILTAEKNGDIAEIFKKGKLVLDVQDGFKLIESNPAIDANSSTDKKLVWLFDDLQNDFKINLKASLIGEQEQIKEIKATLLLLKNNNEETPLICELKKNVLITAPPLIANLKINNLSVDNQSADLGENLNFEINYANNSEEDLKGLVLEINFLGEKFFNWSSLDFANGAIKITPLDFDSGQKLVFDKSQISQLGILSAKQIGKINFSLKTLDQLTGKRINQQSQIQTTLKAGDFLILSNQINLKLNTKLNLLTEGRYFSDEYIQVGAGPLPPKVGEKTTYKVFWSLSNTNNSVNNIQVKTVLPDYVNFEGSESTSQGKITYDTAKKEINWQMDRLDPYSGGIYSNIEASFKVSITPSTAQIGQVLLLTQNIFASGVDGFTNAEIFLQKDSLTTNLPTDPLANGKGKVSE